MSKTYEAIYTQDGHLTWLGERPAAGRHNVIVTVQDQPARAQDGPPPTSEEIQHLFDEMQRLSITPENAARINNMNALVDVSELARQVGVPTLVLHCQGDQRVPMEEGRRMAALIPGARFVALEGNNHALIEGTPAFDAFFAETHAFLREHGG